MRKILLLSLLLFWGSTTAHGQFRHMLSTEIGLWRLLPDERENDQALLNKRMQLLPELTIGYGISKKYTLIGTYRRTDYSRTLPVRSTAVRQQLRGRLYGLGIRYTSPITRELYGAFSACFFRRVAVIEQTMPEVREPILVHPIAQGIRPRRRTAGLRLNMTVQGMLSPRLHAYAEVLSLELGTAKEEYTVQTSLGSSSYHAYLFSNDNYYAFNLLEGVGIRFFFNP